MQSKQMPFVFAGFGQKNVARYASVGKPFDCQIVHSDRFAADMRDKRYAARFQDVRNHCGHRGFAVRTRDSHNRAEHFGNGGQKFLTREDQLACRKRRGEFGVVERYRRRIHDNINAVYYVRTTACVNLGTEF